MCLFISVSMESNFNVVFFFKKITLQYYNNSFLLDPKRAIRQHAQELRIAENYLSVEFPQTKWTSQEVSEFPTLPTRIPAAAKCPFVAGMLVRTLRHEKYSQEKASPTL